MLDRFERMLSMIDTRGHGLEIGASYSPIVPKRKGYDVQVVDHADAKTLRMKYADDPGVGDKVENIEEVDYVWTSGPLDALIGKPGAYDFIVASHVIEHVPDLLGFLKSCETLLKPTGVLALAVPDKRYCFDYFRPHATVGSVLNAHFEGRNRHTPGTIFDAKMLSCTMRGSIVWMDGWADPVALIHGPDFAWEQCLEARKSGDYIDVHAWQFTPSSFRLILKTLHELRLVNLGEASFFDTVGCEFMIGLSKAAPPPHASYLDLCHAIEAELADGRVISLNAQQGQVTHRPKTVEIANSALAGGQTLPPPSARSRWPLGRRLRKALSLNGLRRIAKGQPL